jgi:UDP-N-acetylmuramate--alanine ligase
MNIYFSGLGGVGIGPLVEIARDAGHTVLGSDLVEGLVTEELQALGIPVNIGQDGTFLRASHQEAPIDWFVYTSALPDDHPELVLAHELGLRVGKRDEFLAYIIQEKGLKLVAISGTHGKTTTTGMAVWTFLQLGIPVSYSVGTTLPFGPSGKYDPASQYFVYECDEYDRNFLHFQPHVSVLTSVDYDHPDTYPEEQEYIDAFQQFIAQSDHTVLWNEDADYIGGKLANTWVLDDTLPTTLAGEHNRRNATLVAKTLEYLGISNQDEVLDALSKFPGTDRRFERLADNLYTDYGHHPVEIAATLQLARELSDHVVLVYQPHQNRRQYRVRDMYTNQFEQAETVYWIPTYLSREDPDQPILTPEELIENITNKAQVHPAELDHALWDTVQRTRDAGKLVLFMGAGTIDGWVREHFHTARTAGVVLVDSEGQFLLQKRDDKPTINNPGMLTSFGGAVEGEETNREAALRELGEETNLTIESADLDYLVTIYQPMTIEGIPRYITYFTLKDVNAEQLEVYEGQGYQRVNPLDDLGQLPLSPPTVEMIAAYNKLTRNQS